VWRWNAEGGYSRVDTGNATNQQLKPFEGYFIFARQPRGVKLVFTATAAQTTALRTTANTASNWQLPLMATTSTARDLDNSFGVSELVGGKPARTAAAKPPASVRSLTVAFTSSGNATLDATRAGDNSGWADSFLAPFASTGNWNLLVDGANSGQAVRLNWGNVLALPAAIDLTLVDLVSGKRTNMAATRTYSFVADGAARNFRIEGKVRPASLGNVAVGNFTTSGSATVAAVVNTTGAISVDIETAGGDLVRNLATSQMVSAGTFPRTLKWTWNGTNSQNSAVPAGEYVARVQFTDDRNTVFTKTVRFTLKRS
ncbi:MAG TPA: hypothetical protein VF719_02680, partial [Abditibacteriaceae bacterium]